MQIRPEVTTMNPVEWRPIISQFATQKITLTKALRLSKLEPEKPGAETEPVNVDGVPLNAGAEFVPAGVIVWECVPSAEPVNAGEELEPVNVAGVPLKAGAEFVPAAVIVCEWFPSADPVNAGAEFVPDGVKVWLCVPRADPVKVCAGTVPPDPLKDGTPTGQAIVPAGVKDAVLFVPAGVKAAVPFVGTPAGQAIVPAGVKAAVPFVGTPAGHESV